MKNASYIEYIISYGILGMRDNAQRKTNLEGGGPLQSWNSHLIGEGVGKTTRWQRSLLFCGVPELVYKVRIGIQLQGKQEATLWSTSVWMSHS